MARGVIVETASLVDLVQVVVLLFAHVSISTKCGMSVGTCKVGIITSITHQSNALSAVESGTTGANRGISVDASVRVVIIIGV